MEVGYKLIRASDGAEVQSWGGVWGVSPGVPNPLVLPNGDQVCAAQLDTDYGGYRLAAWEMGPGPAQIDAERDRRIGLGVTVTVNNETFLVQTRNEADFRNINGIASKGIVLQLQGDATTTVAFRDANNASHTLNGPGLIAMADQVAARVQAIYAAAWALKALDPIPVDFAADARWPA